MILNNLLEKLSKLVGLNLNYFIRNGSWVALRFLVMALSGWLVSLFFARASSKEVLGQYQLVLSYISMLVVFSLPGLNSAALEAVVKSREGGVIKAVKISFFCSLMAIPVFSAWGMYDIFFKNEALLGKTLIMAGFLVPFYYAFNTWTAYYDGKMMFKSVSLRMIIINLVQSFLLIAGIIQGFNAFGLVAIYLLVNISFFVWFYVEVYKKIRNKDDNHIDIGFGIKTSIQKLVLGLSGNVPPIIIALLFGVEPVAIYYIANYMICAISSFMGTMGMLYIPILFRNLKLNHKNIVFQNLAIGVLFWLCFLLFLKILFTLMYGAGYSESLRLAYVISFVVILVPLKNYFINFFMTQKRNWLLIWTVGAANIVAAIILLLTKNQEFVRSVSYYIYAIELMTVLPLLANYFLLALKDKQALKIKK